MKAIDSTRVVVVGGGLVGAAALAELARAGVDAVLVERHRIGSGATRLSTAAVRVLDPDPELTELGREGQAGYDTFPARFGRTCGFRRTGHLTLAERGAGRELARRTDRLAGTGVAVEWLPAERAQRQFPQIDWRGLDGAGYEPRAGFGDPLRTARAWVAYARARGARSIEGLAIEGPWIVGDRLRGVLTPRGPIEAPMVVLAAGAWAGGWLDRSDLPHRLRTKGIEVARLARTPAVDGPAFVDESDGLYGRPDGEGGLYVGRPTVRWNVDPDRPPTPDPTHGRRVLAAAGRRWPGFADAARREMRSGFDGYTSDGRGLLGWAPTLAGLLLACGWSGRGYTFAPALGRRIAERIVHSPRSGR